jgi:hypothetical protein
MRARGDEVPGRSQVVSGDLSSMVEANMAQMLESFSSDNIVEFDPVGPEVERKQQKSNSTIVDMDRHAKTDIGNADRTQRIVSLVERDARPHISGTDSPR